MGKGMKAGKSDKPSNRQLTEYEFKKRLRDLEAQFNQELKDLQAKWKRDYDLGLEITHHNNNLWAQVVLFVALKRLYNFGPKRMMRIGKEAQNITEAMGCNQETFAALVEELDAVGLHVDQELRSWNEQAEEEEDETAMQRICTRDSGCGQESAE